MHIVRKLIEVEKMTSKTDISSLVEAFEEAKRRIFEPCKKLNGAERDLANSRVNELFGIYIDKAIEQLNEDDAITVELQETFRLISGTVPPRVRIDKIDEVITNAYDQFTCEALPLANRAPILSA